MSSPDSRVDPTLRIVLVGFGRIAEASHLPAIAVTPGARVVGIVDTSADARTRADAYLRTTGCMQPVVLSSLDDAIAEFAKSGSAPGAAPLCWVICTPSGLHPVQAEQIVRALPHSVVLLEKPVGTDLARVDALLDALERHPTAHCYVVKQNRFNPAVQLLREAIVSGRLGRIYHVNTTVYWNRNDDYYRQAPWRGTWRHDGGAFLNQAVHYVDLMRWLGGPVSQVMAQTATLARDIEAEDTGAAILRYRNGAIGVLQVTVLTAGGNREGSITVIGERGTIKIGGTALNRMEWWDMQPGATSGDPVRDQAMDMEAETLRTTNNPASVYGSGHVAVYRELARAPHAAALPGVAEARRSLQIVLGAYRSAQGDVGVALPMGSPTRPVFGATP